LLIEDDRLFLEEIKEFEPENYEKEKQFLLPHFNNVYVDKDTWFIAGEAGMLAKSDNKGKDWQRIETDYLGSYFAISHVANGQYLLAGLRGNTFVSKNVMDWSDVPMPAPATINNLFATESGTYLFANSGNLFFVNNEQQVTHTLLPDGKAVMAGTVFKGELVLATEAGIKTLPLSAKSKQ